jgi:hypothetical protein
VLNSHRSMSMATTPSGDGYDKPSQPCTARLASHRPSPSSSPRPKEREPQEVEGRLTFPTLLSYRRMPKREQVSLVPGTAPWGLLVRMPSIGGAENGAYSSYSPANVSHCVSAARSSPKFLDTYGSVSVSMRAKRLSPSGIEVGRSSEALLTARIAESIHLWCRCGCSHAPSPATIGTSSCDPCTSCRPLSFFA